MAYNETDKHEIQTSTTSGRDGVEFGWDIIAPNSEDCVCHIPLGFVRGFTEVEAAQSECDEWWNATRQGAELIAEAFDRLRGVRSTE